MLNIGATITPVNLWSRLWSLTLFQRVWSVAPEVHCSSFALRLHWQWCCCRCRSWCWGCCWWRWLGEWARYQLCCFEWYCRKFDESASWRLLGACEIFCFDESWSLHPVHSLKSHGTEERSVVLGLHQEWAFRWLSCGWRNPNASSEECSFAHLCLCWLTWTAADLLKMCWT